MAQAATNPKIEELRFRLKTDPRSRLFYQLAEELRKAGHFDESEQVLRSGLSVYPTYLAAWVSLGRVLREQKNDAGAVEALNRAMQLDPGNVVAARLLADAYRNLGDNVEAIKKYKLVLALMPGDEELKGTIDTLDRAIRHALEPEPEPEPETGGGDAAYSVGETAAFQLEDDPDAATPASLPADLQASQPAEAFALGAEDAAATAAVPPFEDSPFDRTSPPFDEHEAVATGDVEPMLAAHEESPFEEPVEHTTAAAIEIEAPMGFHIDDAPLSAEVPTPVTVEDDEADVFAPAAPEPHVQTEEPTNTLTMADLYARQGLVNDARHIYEHILSRDPSNVDVRAKLDAITPHVNPRIERLERWLAKVSKKEVGRV
ncbi:MAG TPA: tetratricopeptide repeat protein [Thermoanaerobaculia bacterium]